VRSSLKIFLFVTGLLFLSSCENVIQIKLDEGSKIYVIDAFVNNLRTDQVIRVTTNDSYFSNRTPPAVANANVVLKDLTANVSYNFPYTSEGNYVHTLLSTDTIARIGHQYQLEVTIDGYLYTSLEEQHRAAKIDSVSVTLNDGSFGPKTDDTTYYCLLFARDKADNNADYYWLKTFRNDTLFSQPEDINICIDGTGGIVKDAPADSISFTPGSTFLGFKSYHRNDKIAVEIHSISRDNYFFFIQAYNQINNQGLFATTPENIKTNVNTPGDAKTKAIGRFSVSSVATYSRIVK
jgi:hypothetical protein